MPTFNAKMMRSIRLSRAARTRIVRANRATADGCQSSEGDAARKPFGNMAPRFILFVIYRGPVLIRNNLRLHRSSLGLLDSKFTRRSSYPLNAASQ